eukprot:4608723-Alexandrium_andersonii.AAC.1
MCVPATFHECVQHGDITSATWKAGTEQARRIDFVVVPMECKQRVSCAAETHAVDVLHDVNDHRMTVATLELDAIASQ